MVRQNINIFADNGDREREVLIKSEFTKNYKKDFSFQLVISSMKFHCQFVIEIAIPYRSDKMKTK